MSEAAEKLAALPRAERAELVEYLTALNTDTSGADAGEEELTPEEWEAAWADESDRRIQAARNGKTVGVPAVEFMRRMKEKYG